jgi:hypothetical protein
LIEGLEVLPTPLPKKKSQNQILDNLKGFHEPTQKDLEGIVGEGGIGGMVKCF